MIKREMSLLLQKNSSDLMNTLISVTTVRVSPDLSFAKIYVSIFPKDKEKSVFEAIQKNKDYFRFSLAQKIKNRMRKMPDLQFHLDDSLDYAARIETLLRK